MIFSRLVEGLQAVREASDSLNEFHRTLDILRERIRVLEEARRSHVEFMVREFNGIDHVLAEYDQRLENIEEQTELSTQETVRQQIERDYNSMISGMFPIPDFSTADGTGTATLSTPTFGPPQPPQPTIASAMHSFTIPPPPDGPPPLPVRPTPRLPPPRRVIPPNAMDALEVSGNISETYLDPDGNVDLNDDTTANYIYLMNQPPFRPRRHHAFAPAREGTEITRGLTPVHVIPRQTPFTVPEPFWNRPEQSCGLTEETVPPPLR